MDLRPNKQVIDKIKRTVRVEPAFPAANLNIIVESFVDVYDFADKQLTFLKAERDRSDVPTGSRGDEKSKVGYRSTGQKGAEAIRLEKDREACDICTRLELVVHVYKAFDNKLGQFDAPLDNVNLLKKENILPFKLDGVLRELRIMSDEKPELFADRIILNEVENALRSEDNKKIPRNWIAARTRSIVVAVRAIHAELRSRGHEALDRELSLHVKNLYEDLAIARLDAGKYANIVRTITQHLNACGTEVTDVVNLPAIVAHLHQRATYCTESITTHASSDKSNSFLDDENETLLQRIQEQQAAIEHLDEKLASSQNTANEGRHVRKDRDTGEADLMTQVNGMGRSNQTPMQYKPKLYHPRRGIEGQSGVVSTINRPNNEHESGILAMVQRHDYEVQQMKDQLFGKQRQLETAVEELEEARSFVTRSLHNEPVPTTKLWNQIEQLVKRHDRETDLLKKTWLKGFHDTQNEHGKLMGKQKAEHDAAVRTLRTQLEEEQSESSKAQQDYLQIKKGHDEDKACLEKTQKVLEGRLSSCNGKLQLEKTTVRTLQKELEKLSMKLKEHEESTNELRQEHETLITDIQTRHKNSITRTVTTHTRKLADLETALSNATRAQEVMKEDHEKQIKQYENQLHQARLAHERAIGQIQTTHEQKLQQLREQHAEHLQDQEEKHGQDLLDADHRHEARKQELLVLQDRLHKRENHMALMDVEILNGQTSESGELELHGMATLLAEVQKFSAWSWREDRSVWTHEVISDLVGDKQKRLKKLVLGDLIWTTLYHAVFASPFRFIGEVGTKLENDWSKNFDKDTTPGETYKWPPPTLDSEKWRYDTCHDALRSLTKPTSEFSDDGRLKRSFFNNHKIIRKQLLEGLEQLVELDEEQEASLESFLLNSVRMWLCFGTQRYRLRLTVPGSLESSLEKKVELAMEGKLVLTTAPKLRRFGNPKGTELQQCTVVSGCEGGQEEI